METFFVEFTDTYGGEANYCWVDRYKVMARDLKHAITKAKQARYTSPVPRHKFTDYGDEVRIDMVGSPVCAFAWEYDEHYHSELDGVKEIE